MNESIDSWVELAKQGRIAWSDLAERILKCEHPVGGAHQPDLDRVRRCGFPEVIFGSGKSVESIVEIAQRLLAAGGQEILVTRVTSETFRELCQHFSYLRYDVLGRTLRVSHTEIKQPGVPQQLHGVAAPCCVSVVSAGSTDLPIAREAIETLAWMGFGVQVVCDVGVAGPYRLLSRISELRDSVAIVVVAGMEGALASVVGGLVSCPVVAVPTSVGYGANLGGITTLLSMLSSCAASVTVVNVDAGFKGGYVAGLIARQVALHQVRSGK